MNNLSEKEWIFGSEKVAEDLGCCSLIQEDMGKVSLTAAAAADDVGVINGVELNMKNDDVKQQVVIDDAVVNTENDIVKNGGENRLKDDVKQVVLNDAYGVNNENEMKNDVVKDSGDLEDSDTSEEESSSSSSESFTSSSDDDDDDVVVKGPIRSKNEV